MKRFAVIGVLLLALSSCSSGRSAEQLQTLVDYASMTGSLKEMVYDPSYGTQSTWCLNLANEYIASVMGFDGTNGDSDMGDVSQAYFKGCMGF
jgi:hypothetical protein